MRRLGIIWVFLLASAARLISGELEVTVQAKVRALGDPPEMVSTTPEDGSTINTPTPSFRVVFNVDMDTTRTDPSKVVLPDGMTVSQLIWLDAKTLSIQYNGMLPSFGAKRVALLDGYFITPGKISIELGAGFAFNYADPNHAPFIVLGPTVKQSGGLASFSSLGFDPDGDAITYTWDFGDGTTGDGQNVTHQYVGEGPFLATLTVSDGRGGKANASVLVGAAAKSPWIVIKAQVALNFVKPGLDKITIAGTVELPAGFDPNNKVMSIDFGGVQKSFTLNAKGMAKVEKNTAKLTRKLVKKQFQGGAVKLMFNLRGAFAQSLADDGFVNTTVKGTTVPMLVLLVLDGRPYQAAVDFSYTAKANKTGRATKKTAVR